MSAQPAQAELQFAPARRRPKGGQLAALLMALERQHTISPEGSSNTLSARRVLGIRALAQRISDLVNIYGVPVCRGRERVSDRTCVGVYWLCDNPVGCTGCGRHRMFRCSRATMPDSARMEDTHNEQRNN